MVRAGSAHNTLQRCSRPLSRSQTTTPHQPHTSASTDHAASRALGTEAPDTPGRAHTRGRRPILQNPNSVPPPTSSQHGRHTGQPTSHRYTTRVHGQGNVDDSTSEHHHCAHTTGPPANAGARVPVGVCAP